MKFVNIRCDLIPERPSIYEDIDGPESLAGYISRDRCFHWHCLPFLGPDRRAFILETQVPHVEPIRPGEGARQPEGIETFRMILDEETKDVPAKLKKWHEFCVALWLRAAKYYPAFILSLSDKDWSVIMAYATREDAQWLFEMDELKRFDNRLPDRGSHPPEAQESTSEALGRAHSRSMRF